MSKEIQFPITEKLLISPKETARLLSLSEPTVYRRIADGTIPSIRISHAVRVPLSALRRMVGEDL